MINVQLVKTENCSHCAQVKAVLEKLTPEFPEMKVSEILMTTDEGTELVQKHGIMASPGVVINDELAFQGGATEDQLRKKLNESKNHD